MRKIDFIFLAMLVIVGCRGGDFQLKAPTSSMNSFKKVNFNHNLFLTASCIQCHESKRPISLLAHGNGGDCLLCHTAALNSAGTRTWMNVVNFTHSPTPASCIQCHEGSRPMTGPHAKGAWGEKQDCSSCHNFPSWNMARFDHNKPLTTCFECHQVAKDARPTGPYASLHPTIYYDALRSYYKDLSTGSNHLATIITVPPIILLQGQTDILKKLDNVILINQNDSLQMDCILCHSNSDNTKKWANTSINFRYVNHSPAPTSCIACHEIQRPSNHASKTIVVGMDKADCQACHKYSKDSNGVGTPKESDWRDLVTAFNHETQMPESCMGCHENSIPMDQRPILTGVANSIHPTAQGTYYKIDCMKCHTYAATTTLPRAWNKIIFDYKTHLLTNTAGNVSNPSTCIQCHKIDNNSLPNSLVNDSHTRGARLNNDCVVCHSFDSVSKWQRFVSPFDHVRLDVPTDRCDGCHKEAVTGLNSLAKIAVQNKIHIAITQSYDCNSCHTSTNIWKNPNVNYLHGKNDNCSSCHSLSNPKNWAMPAVTQLPTAHFPIGTTQCNVCHTEGTFKTWTGGIFDHKNISGLSCSSCHNNSVYSGTVKQLPSIPIFHLAIPGNSDCNTCHTNTNSFAGMTLPMLNVSYGHSNNDLNCIACHTGASGYGKGINFVNNHMSINSAQCSTCHQDVTSVGALTINYTSFTIHSVSATTNPNSLPLASDSRCTICHSGVAAPGKTTSTYSGHVVIGNLECTTCHSASLKTSPKYSSFANGSNHNALSTVNFTSCNQCHLAVNGDVQNIATNPTYKHFTIVNSLNTKIECQVCHQNSVVGATPFANFSGGKFHAVTTAIATTNCSTCHTVSGSYTGFTQFTTAVTHLPLPIVSSTATDCSTCHQTTSAWKGMTLSTPSSQNVTYAHAINSTTDAVCINCHTGDLIGFAEGVSSGPNNHLPLPKKIGSPSVTAQCSSCHTNQKWSNWTNGPASSTYLTHNILDTDCNSCHTNQRGFAKGMDSYIVSTHKMHIPTIVQCGTCHASSSTVTGTSTTYSNFANGTYVHDKTFSFSSYAIIMPPVGTTSLTYHNEINTCTICHDSNKTFPVAPLNFYPYTGNFFYRDMTIQPATTITLNSGSVAARSITCAGCHAVSGSNHFTTGGGHSSGTPESHSLTYSSATVTQSKTIVINGSTFTSAVITGFKVGDLIRFSTTGNLPAGIIVGTTYYVKTIPTTVTFTIAMVGSATTITTSGTQNGVHQVFQTDPHGISLSNLATYDSCIICHQKYSSWSSPKSVR